MINIKKLLIKKFSSIIDLSFMKTTKLITALNDDKKQLISFTKRLFEENKNLYIRDFYVLGAVKRNYGNINGITSLVNAKNMNASRCLLRVHLDTVLRFQAFWYVEDIDQFIIEVMKGNSVNKFKDRLGNKLTDGYLADLLNRDYPWVKRVYKNLCSYIHFSDAHIWEGIDSKGIMDNKFTFAITNLDQKYPEKSWQEILECTNHINLIFQKYLESYELSRNSDK